MTDLTYEVGYAKTRKAACKGCKKKIDQGTIRIAIEVQSAFSDGKIRAWHHEKCFFKKYRPNSVGEIANFIKLTNDDQKRIKYNLEKSCIGIVMPEPQGKSNAKKRAANEDSARKDFKIEYSKTNKARCRHCEIKICKDEVRIAKIVYNTDIGYKYGGEPLWHHVKCFAEQRSALLFFAGGESLPGFSGLKTEDQTVVKNAIKPFASDEVPVKKLKQECKDPAEEKEKLANQKKIEEQNELFDKHRQALKELTPKNLKELLESNSQKVPTRKDECLDRVADMMAFGALAPCPQCKKGQLILDNFGYKCTGNINEWSKCTYETQNPEREPMSVPESYKDSSIFKKFIPKMDVRLFEAAPRPAFNKDKPVVKKEIPALKNLQFFIYGQLKDKEETKKRILKLGGLCVNKVTDTLAAVVSTKEAVEKMSKKMIQFKNKNIEIVKSSFLDLIEKHGAVLNLAKPLEIIKESNIADWGSDPARRIPQDVKDGKSIPKSGSMYSNSQKSTIKLKVKGNAVVDPDSKLQDKAHVYKNEEGTIYSVVLAKTDVITHKNSFYKLQLLEAINDKRFWVFRSWGRIGTTIGDSLLTECKNLKAAIAKFQYLYYKKTNNRWQHPYNFEKVADKYFPLDMGYGGDDGTTNSLAEVSKCDLPEAVEELIIKLFDHEYMKETLLEYELDTKKMPLGILSKKQIQSGYEVLSELISCIENKSPSYKIRDATNRFFNLIPHDFGLNNAPLLDNIEIITNKITMLDNLLEMEVAYCLLKMVSDETSRLAYYSQLKADIVPLPTDSPDFEMIAQYVTNTHARTHKYTLSIQQVFKVVREGEDELFKPFKKLHNRRLLWHGSRLTNFVSIISQGLRIAPPEAPMTGYMFGKGIYFADMVSKSAQYCKANTRNPYGLLLLCEVALGNMKECKRAEDVKLTSNMHSAWGMGRTQPDSTQNKVLEDGVIVPLGTPVRTKITTCLRYNEFIVYNVAQVNVKYLLQVKFNYKE